MKKRILKSALLLIALMLSATFAQCGGGAGVPGSVDTGSPAGPPAPPAEIPSPIVLKFIDYNSMRIDLASIQTPITPMLSKKVTPGDNVLMDIRSGPDFLAQLEYEFLVPLTAGLGQIPIPVGETITQYSDVVNITASGNVEGTVMQILTGYHTVKFDFGDFDFDNDGTTEGCSGNSGVLPVCVRFWLDDVRLIAWIFDEAPTDTANGRGRYKFFFDNPAIAPAIVTYAVSYGPHGTDDPSKQLELFMKALKSATADPLWADVPDSQRWHLFAYQTGAAPETFKSINYNAGVSLTAESVDYDWVQKYLGQFVENVDLWSGSYEFLQLLPEPSFAIVDEEDVCARYSDGYALLPTDCENAGGRNIRVGTALFVDALDDADVSIPNDFPLTAPF